MSVWGYVVMALLVSAVLSVGVVIGYTLGGWYERREAVAAGVGRWVVDDKTGEREFVYGSWVQP